MPGGGRTELACNLFRLRAPIGIDHVNSGDAAIVKATANGDWS